MTLNEYTIVEICDLADPLLLPWLDLYEMSFPPDQRPPISQTLRWLRDPHPPGQDRRHFLAVTDGADPSRLVALIDYYEPANLPAAFLWYFALAPEARGQGLGSKFYRLLLETLRPGTRVLIFDLEDPSAMPTLERQELARRRIGFYRRQGARLLGGIQYNQRVALYQPALHLRLMVHPIVPISPEEAFELARPVLGDAITQIETLRWE